MSIIYEALQKVEKKPPYARPRISTSPKPKKYIDKSFIIILIVSIITLGLLYSFQGKKSTKTFRPPKNSSTFTSNPLPGNELQDKSTGKPARFVLPRISFTRTDSKHRTYSYNTKVHEGVELTLSGIIYAEKESIAIINGRRVTIGDAIKEAKVTDIRENSVELTVNDKKITLALY